MTLLKKIDTRRGFTLLELLIAVIIIGILVAIIIPVLTTRAEDARLTAVEQDLEALATAEQHAGIDTGYFYRLYVLDDIVGGDNTAPDVAPPGRDIIDGVRDENRRSDAANNTDLFLDTREGYLYGGGPIYARLVANETEFNWNGPYVNYKNKQAHPSTLPPPAGGTNYVPTGSPVDPWGNPYMLFTKQGLMKEPEGIIEPNTVLASDGNNYATRVFDRPTILSLGANMRPGDGSGPGSTGFGQGDDIYRQF